MYLFICLFIYVFIYDLFVCVFGFVFVSVWFFERGMSVGVAWVWEGSVSDPGQACSDPKP